MVTTHSRWGAPLVPGHRVRGRRLTAIATVHKNTGERRGKLHINPACDALDGINQWSHTKTFTFRSLWHFAGEVPGGVLCRMCALEDTLTYLLARRDQGPRTLHTFNAQRPPGGAGYRHNEVSPGAAERFRTVCERLGLPYVSSRIGPSSYAHLTDAQAERIGNIARILQLPNGTDVNDPMFDERLSVFWTSAVNEPPETSHEPGRVISEHWTMADLFD